MGSIALIFVRDSEPGPDPWKFDRVVASVSRSICSFGCSQVFLEASVRLETSYDLLSFDSQSPLYLPLQTMLDEPAGGSISLSNVRGTLYQDDPSDCPSVYSGVEPHGQALNR
jgi:hypothetical protein